MSKKQKIVYAIVEHKDLPAFFEAVAEALISGEPFLIEVT